MTIENDESFVNRTSSIKLPRVINSEYVLKLKACSAAFADILMMQQRIAQGISGEMLKKIYSVMWQ